MKIVKYIAITISVLLNCFTAWIFLQSVIYTAGFNQGVTQGQASVQQVVLSEIQKNGKLVIQTGTETITLIPENGK